MNPPNPPRCGAIRKIQISGAPADLVHATSCCSGMGFRQYINTQLSNALEIARIVARPSNSDIEEDFDSPSNMELGVRARETPIFSRARLSAVVGRYWMRAPGSAGVQYLDLNADNGILASRIPLSDLARTYARRPP